MASDALYPFAATPRQYPLGSDIAGVTAVDYALSTVSGRRALAEAILRRLTTRRGALWYSPSYGYSMLDLIGSSVPSGVVEQRITEQCLLEEEVQDAVCTVSAVDTGGSRALTATISLVDAAGPFDLTLTSSELSISALLDGTEIFSEAA